MDERDVISKPLQEYGISTLMREDDQRQDYWKKQREERGFDETETWSLDQAIAKFVVPRLKAFKEDHVCHPHGMTMEAWDEIIQKMIDGFEEVLRRDESPSKYNSEKVQEGLSLFAEWYHDLWW
jgi:hypothetical protein